MTRESFFRAVGEVRTDQIEAAESMKKQPRPWRRYGALAACLAVIAAACAAPWLGGQARWRELADGFEPLPGYVEAPSGGVDAGDTDAGGGLDGSDYWTDGNTHPASSYSENVEIGQLSGPGTGGTMSEMSACLAWRLSPEEILAQDTVIFRGTVQELHYFMVTADGTDLYYTRAILKVTDPIRGSLNAGEVCSVIWLGAAGYMSTSISGPLDGIEVGGDVIFMPARTTQETGWRSGDSYFCYADLADLYLDEGMRYVFADTGNGLNFERGLYTGLAEAESLDDVAEYLRGMLEETSQPAAVPAEPQAAPSATAQAGDYSSGPAGARELPGGAYIGE